jgi:membrane protease YdiL (CAAX protease family)
MSSFQNPLSESSPPSLNESSTPSTPAPAGDLAWSGWDVLQIAVLTIVSILVLAMLVGFAAQRLLYPHAAYLDVLKYPVVAVVAQLLAYVLVFAFMVLVIKREPGRRFWKCIQWNWPGWAGGTFLVCGTTMYFVLLGVGQLLPIPKHLPIDQFFRTAGEATLLSIVSVTAAPLMEELFFRGFLYPVLARRLGTGVGVLITAALFGLLHGAQLGYSWAVLIIFLVGLALTIVRAVTNSVAASFLTHVGYNGTLSVLLLVATDGFRHLEKLNQ